MEVVAAEQRQPEVDTDIEDAVEAGLQRRRTFPHQYSGAAILHGLTKGDTGGGEPSDNTAYLDENGGALEDLDVHKIPNSSANNYGITETTSASSEVSLRSGITEEEVVEEEVVELEFEKAISKLHSHTMHCPNCDAQITKVVLRRKIFKMIGKPPPIEDEPEKPVDLLGCLSCFSLFTSAGNPFSIFREKPRKNAVPQSDGNEEDMASGEDGNCFSIFRVLRKGPDVPTKEDMAQPGFVDPPSPSPAPDNKYVARKPPGRHGESPPLDVTPEKPESSIDIPPATSPATGVQTQGEVAGQDSTSFEILKSVVYGGLMEVIASLSVVASAVAADATTLTIVALALANLIGGIFVIGHNLWDLRDDCYKFSSQVTRNKYKELLGQVEHFPLHVFFAILSFFVFGIIPPVAYGYSIHETNDKDFTIVAVVAASLVCVGLLAIFKAYVDRCTGFLGYIKTIAYYLTTTIAVSGVSYVVGNLVTRLIEELGLFETTSGVAMSLLPQTNPSLAYY